MLGKIIKYEFRSVSKLLIIIHIVMLLIAALASVAGVFIDFDNLDALSPVMRLFIMAFLILYILSLFAICMMTNIYLPVRYFRSMYTDEGYLTHTLPAAPWQLMLGKGIVFFVWSLVDMLLFFFSVMLMFAPAGFFTHFPEILQATTTELGIGTGTFLAEMIIGLVIGIISSISMAYLAIAIGSFFHNHKALGSVVSYIGLYFIIQIIALVYMFSSNIMSISYNAGYDAATTGTASLPPDLFSHTLLWNIVTSLVFAVVAFIIAHYITKNKLNLD